MTRPVLVTAYENPDLDGSACAFAYAEFLNKTGVPAIAVQFGTPSLETQFVIEQYGVPQLQSGEKIVEKDSRIIITDASDPHGLHKKINLAQVIEIIDHRKVNEAEKFPNAKVQIEFVGAAATLIAEKFFEEKIEISKESAMMLYGAIVSNTINFKARVTTDRDKKMAEWLLTKCAAKPTFVRDMFTYKSRFTKPLVETMGEELATSLGGYPLAISQLEIINVESFVRDHIAEIKAALATLLKKSTSKYIMLTCVDVEKGFNMFVCVDDETRILVETALKVIFQDGVAKRNGILMRKEIVPLLTEILRNKVTWPSKEV